MSENNPSALHKIDSDPTEPKKVITPTLAAAGRLYLSTPIPILPEDASQVEILMQELFSSINTGEPEFQERNMQIVRRYFGIDDETKPTPSQLKKEFNLSGERIRTIAERFRRRAIKKAQSDEKLSDIPNFLPFKAHQIGYALFGGDIIKKEIKDKLPEDIILKDLNLTPQVLERLEPYHSQKDDLFSFLSSSSHIVSPKTIGELNMALKGIAKEPPLQLG